MNAVLTRNKSNLSLNFYSLLEYLLAIFLILNCNTVYDRLANRDLHFNYILAFLAILLMLFYCRKIGLKVIEFLAFTYAIMIFYFIMTYSISDKTNFVLQFFVFFPCMVIYLTGCAKKGKLLDLYRKIANIIFIVALASTVVWIFTEIIPIFSPNGIVTISWGTEHNVRGVFGLFYQCQTENTFGLSLYRNTSIFCEAPMFSLVLSFALIYELFFRKNFSVSRIVLLSFMIVSTFSSTGILFLFIAFAIKYWQLMQDTRTRWKVIYIVGLFIVIPILYIGLYMLFEAKSDTGSYSMRIVDYITGFLAWRDHPLFGVGYNNITPLYEHKSVLMARFGIYSSGIGFSNSITGILAQGGLILFLFYLVPFVIVGIRAERYGNKNYRYFLILFMFLFVFTIFHARFIMIYFLALLYSVILCGRSTEQKA